MSVCVYLQGHDYPNLSLMPDEWAAASVTLLLDQGPVYFSIDLLAPLQGGSVDYSAPQLGVDKRDALLILRSLVLD